MSVTSMVVKSAAALVVVAPMLVTSPSVGASLPASASGDGRESVATTWESPVALADYTRGSAFVVDAHSETTVVWEAVTGEVMSVRRAADGTWTQPEIIGQSHAAFGSPQVAADADGNLTAVWITQQEGVTDGVMAATWTAISGWSDPVSISRDRSVATYPSDDLGPWGAAHLALAVNPEGAAVVAWDWGSEDRNKPWRVQSVYHRPGRGWSDVADVTRARGYRSPQVGISAVGTAVLLYARQPMGHPQALLSQRRHVGEGWTTATTVARKGYGEQLAVDRAGDAVVAFTPNWSSVMATYRPSGTRWRTARRLSPAGVRVNDHFSLAMNGRGKALVAMGRRHGRVDLVQRRPHTAWTAPVAAVKSSDSSQLVEVALNASGDTFLGWGEYALLGKYRPDGSTWTSRFTISPDPGADVLDSISAQVAPNGDVIVMWAQEDHPLYIRVMTAA